MKRIVCLLIVLTTAIWLASCGTAPSAQQPPANGGTAGSQPHEQQSTRQDENRQTPSAPVAEPQPMEQTIQIYYTDEQLTRLLTEEREIHYHNDLEKYEQALNLLQHPEDPAHYPLWKEFHYHSVNFQDGKLTIDVSGENQYNLGSGGEAMAIDALSQTLFQFPEVESIVILVDGKPTESLMGHVDISQPITRTQP